MAKPLGSRSIFGAWSVFMVVGVVLVGGGLVFNCAIASVLLLVEAWRLESSSTLAGGEEIGEVCGDCTAWKYSCIRSGLGELL